MTHAFFAAPFLVTAALLRGLRRADAWKLTPEASWPPAQDAAPGEHRRRRQPPAADPSTCVTNGLSVFYNSVYKQDEAVASVYGYDASDKRYRQPPNSDYIPGGNGTNVYTHAVQTQAKLWIGSNHIAHNDEEYLRCIAAEAFVNLQAPILYSRDKFPYWQPYPTAVRGPSGAPTVDESGYASRLPYPASDLTEIFEGWSIPQISMPGREWARFYSQIESFIDTHLAAGQSVFMFDDNAAKEEACGAAGATAVTYVMKKGGLEPEAAIAQLAALLPCIENYLTSNRTLTKIKVLKTRALGICPDEEGHGTDELPCVTNSLINSHIPTRRLYEFLDADEAGGDQSVPEDLEGLIASREDLLAQYGDRLFFNRPEL